MPVCIYCEREKPETAMSEEHVVPQKLGGGSLSKRFRTDRVCEKCNNDLGNFVDASLTRSLFVSAWLGLCAQACFDPDISKPLPLIPRGTTNIVPPGMDEQGEVGELYFGPFGETVCWIRSTKKDIWGYIGGNPITGKKEKTRAYFFINERTLKNPQITFSSFKAAFRDKKGKTKVKKILCSMNDNLALTNMGFSSPDLLDRQRIEYFFNNQTALVNTQPKTNMKFDHRFLAKLARGIGFCLLGERILCGDYARDVYNALQNKPNQLRGRAVFDEHLDPNLCKNVGHPNAITIFIINTPKGIGLNLNIGIEFQASVLCAESAILKEEDLERVESGLVLILFPYLEKAFELSVPEYMAHKTGVKLNEQLARLENQIDRNRFYLRDL